jgi:large subunit ribosomal protein L31
MHYLICRGATRKGETMTKQYRDQYREVVFMDTVTGKKFLTKSTADTRYTIQWEDGKVYPLVKLEVSSDSHPAFTGKGTAPRRSHRPDRSVPKAVWEELKRRQ